MRRVALIALMLTVASAATSRTWNVPTDAPTIQAGIDSATVGDVVALAAGTYHENNLVMKPGITVRGEGGAPDLVVLDGQHTGPIMLFNAENSGDATRLEDLTFADADSCALRCQHVSNLTIERCVFAGNASYGEWPAALMLWAASGSIMIRDCVFADNYSTGIGGAVSLNGVDGVRFERCLWVRNHAGQWGAALTAAYTGEPGAVLDQCTITGNTGAGSWSAVFLVGWGNIEVTRSVVAHNEVKFATNGSGHLGFVDWSCCDLFDNAGDDYSSPWWVFEDGNFSADPCFCAPALDDYSLAADSWCLAGHHPWGCDDLVGAFGEGCAAAGCEGPVAVEVRSWSSVKEFFGRLVVAAEVLQGKVVRVK